MWWVIVFLICAVAFVYLLNRGADMRNKSSYAQKIEDDDQEKVVVTMNHT